MATVARAAAGRRATSPDLPAAAARRRPRRSAPPRRARAGGRCRARAVRRRRALAASAAATQAEGAAANHSAARRKQAGRSCHGRSSMYAGLAGTRPLSYPRRRFAGRSIPAPLDRFAAHDRNRARSAGARAGGRLEHPRRARRRRCPAGRGAALGDALGAAIARHALLRAADRRPRAALRMARPRDAPQPAAAGLSRRRHPRDEDAARVAATLPRHARSPRSGRRAARSLLRTHAPGRRAPRAHRRSGARRRARGPRPPRAPRADRAARAARRLCRERYASSITWRPKRSASRSTAIRSRWASRRSWRWYSATCSTTR